MQYSTQAHMMTTTFQLTFTKKANLLSHANPHQNVTRSHPKLHQHQFPSPERSRHELR